LIRHGFKAKRYYESSVKVPEGSLACDYDHSKYEKQALLPARLVGESKMEHLKEQLKGCGDTTRVQVEIENVRLTLLTDRMVLVKYLKRHWMEDVKGILFFDGKKSEIYVNNKPVCIPLNGQSLVDRDFEVVEVEYDEEKGGKADEKGEKGGKAEVKVVEKGGEELKGLLEMLVSFMEMHGKTRGEKRTEKDEEGENKEEDPEASDKKSWDMLQNEGI
jgi:hypothetical protein